MRDLSISRCRLAKIEPPRALFLQELNAQCRHHAAHWRKGTQHYAIRECYLAGRVPAARTSTDNIASQRTPLKGGLRECGRMLRVSVRLNSQSPRRDG